MIYISYQPDICTETGFKKIWKFNVANDKISYKFHISAHSILPSPKKGIEDLLI